MPAKKMALSLVVLCGMAALLIARPNAKEATQANEMATAAHAFLDTLTDAQKDKASFKFDDSERTNWHFIPRERKGLPLKELEGKALKMAHAFIRTGLSERGYDQTLNVMSLEEVLYLLEGGDRNQRRDRRDPQKYYISIFGKPANAGTWGWRLEGHHLSLNYTITDGKVVSSTPEFFGANPGTIEAGPGRTIRVLGPEEDLARQILKLSTDEQKEVMWLSREAPDDLRGGGVAQPDDTAPVGLPAANMSEDQKKLLAQLLTEYLQNMPESIEKERRAQIEQAGIDKIHFAWWGSSERNKRHYYRIQGPTFLVEYNNTQQSANHVHSIWRDMNGDFNIPLK